MFRNAAQKLVQYNSGKIYGKSIPKCKSKIQQIIPNANPKFCVYDDLNPAT